MWSVNSVNMTTWTISFIYKTVRNLIDARI